MGSVGVSFSEWKMGNEPSRQRTVSIEERRVMSKVKFKGSDAKRQIRRSNGSRLMHVIKPAGGVRNAKEGIPAYLAKERVKEFFSRDPT